MNTISILGDVERSGGFDALNALKKRLAISPHATTGDELAAQGHIIHLGNGTPIEMGGLRGGMTSGKPSVAFCFTLPDGSVVLAETSLALLQAATVALTAALEGPSL